MSIMPTFFTRNSTNVRSLMVSKEELLRAGLKAAARAAPAVAALLAERMFLTPRRHRRPDWESEWATSAKRGEVRYRTHLLPTYSWGEGPAVLLVHGWEGRGTQLGAFVPALVDAGFRVIAVDLPGHGDAGPALTSVVDFAEALRAIIPRLGPFHAIIAHSAGAASTALSYALAPFEARLVLIAAPRSPQSFFHGFMRQLGLGAEVSARAARRIELRYGLPFAELDVDAFAARVSLPALVIHDRHDKEVPFEHATAIANALPHAKLVATEGLGHRRILRDAAVIAQALAFVRGIEPLSQCVAPAA